MRDAAAVLAVGQVASVAVGAQHTCVVHTEGSARCWGSNSNGELGQGDTTSRGAAAGDMGNLSAVELGGLVSSFQIAAGDCHTCVVVSGLVKCWGCGGAGQLGVGGTDSVGTDPSHMGAGLVAANLDSDPAVSVLAVGTYSCYTTAGGDLYCWGTAAWFDGAQLTPQHVQLPFRVSRVSCGLTHCCAVDVGGVVRCWGDGADGQLGAGLRSCGPAEAVAVPGL
mmetsp:Transcript_41040/g.92595  ORF Transcript_41040/g.92595 Transcript_41040/m.92595 type:complete len:223 (-) Transcript_41040:15-683(-)